MAVETILFLDDRFHAWYSGTGILIDSASSTAPGSSLEAVRSIDFASYWKPNDGTSDEYIMIDLGANFANVLGTTGGATIYWVVAYDASEADQNALEIRQDSADNPAGTFSQLKGSFNLDLSQPNEDYDTGVLSTSGKRYYRLYQFNAGRGGGTRTAKIHHWGAYVVAGAKSIDNSGGNVSPGSTAHGLANASLLLSPAGFPYTSRLAALSQSATINMRRVPLQLWKDLVSLFKVTGCSARYFYAQSEGLKNPTKPNFRMVRLGGHGWSANRPYVDQYEASLPLVTGARG